MTGFNCRDILFLGLQARPGGVRHGSARGKACKHLSVLLQKLPEFDYDGGVSGHARGYDGREQVLRGLQQGYADHPDDPGIVSHSGPDGLNAPAGAVLHCAGFAVFLVVPLIPDGDRLPADAEPAVGRPRFQWCIAQGTGQHKNLDYSILPQCFGKRYDAHHPARAFPGKALHFFPRLR